MPADKKIEKFIYILRLLISNSLLDHKYTDIKILLDKTKSIEEIKKTSLITFPDKNNFSYQNSAAKNQAKDLP